VKYIINILLITVISFSIVHEIVIDDYNDGHCLVSEHLLEYSQPVFHDNFEHASEDDELCEHHYIFHLSYILNFYQVVIDFHLKNQKPITVTKNYINSYKTTKFKPPIA